MTDGGMPFRRDSLSSSLIGRSALMRIVFAFLGMALLWLAIGWAVFLP
jgi:hypothetical protein